jgi:hypothetical protein
MNASATTGSRELSAQELDQVTGGLNYNVSENGEYAISFVLIGAMVGSVVGALWDWLFG